MPRSPRIHRYRDRDELVARAANMLLQRLISLQAGGTHVPQLGLSGGRIASQVYAAFAQVAPLTPFDPALLELWWTDERFVPLHDDFRHAGQTLSSLAGALAFDPARTHPMPAADGQVELDQAARVYAQELGDTVFDICMLGMGPDGHVAAIFRDHPSFEPTSQTVIPVRDSPKPPGERLSVSLSVLNRSREVWFVVNGAEKAAAVREALSGNPDVPAARVGGSVRTLWLVDEPAAAELPWHVCDL